MTKLRAEINKQTHENLDRESLQNLPYLQNILKKSKCADLQRHLPPILMAEKALRLYLPVPVNTRTAKVDTVLPTGGGLDRKPPVLIPKGSTVAFSVYTLHRRSDLYGMDAECFRPERWDEDLPLLNDPVMRNYGYLPFSGGPRTCLGSES